MLDWNKLFFDHINRNLNFNWNGDLSIKIYNISFRNRKRYNFLNVHVSWNLFGLNNNLRRLINFMNFRYFNPNLVFYHFLL